MSDKFKAALAAVAGVTAFFLITLGLSFSSCAHRYMWTDIQWKFTPSMQCLVRIDSAGWVPESQLRLIQVEDL